MFGIRRASQRGHADHGWLKTFHTFSFSDYYDPAYTQFRALRVMNEDYVAPGKGFGMHGHRDMEIVTYVLEGELEHRDSMGHAEVLRPGEFQRMTAGTGIRHSEANPSAQQWVHLYQIWLLPREPGLTPSYEQKQFAASERQNRWQLVASPEGENGSLTIQTDANIYLARLDAGQALTFAFAPDRHAWLQVLRGEIEVGHDTLHAGDGLGVTQELNLNITGRTAAELMLFDLR